MYIRLITLIFISYSFTMSEIINELIQFIDASFGEVHLTFAPERTCFILFLAFNQSYRRDFIKHSQGSKVWGIDYDTVMARLLAEEMISSCNSIDKNDLRIRKKYSFHDIHGNDRRLTVQVVKK